ncbi:hypothetical protein [Bacillus subtilis]
MVLGVRKGEVVRRKGYKEGEEEMKNRDKVSVLVNGEVE